MSREEIEVATIPEKKKSSFFRKGNIFEIISIVPTSWGLFVAFCTAFSVIEVLGPFFRYLIFSWQLLTRKFWDYIFELLFSNFSIDLNDADKDGLTVCIFLAIYGASTIPRYIRIVKSEKNSQLRSMDWRLFPIACVISAFMVSIIASTVTEGSVYSDEASVSMHLQAIFFLVIMSIIYLVFSFVPILLSYVLSYILHLFTRNNFFKIVAPIIILIYAILWSSWIPENAKEISLMGTFWVIVVVTFVVVFISLVVPIIQPMKLVNMLAISLIIGAIAAASYYVDYFKNNSNIPGFSTTATSKKDAGLVSASCRKSFGMVFLIVSAAKAKGWPDDPLTICDCFGEQIVQNEPKSVIAEFYESFDKYKEFSPERQAVYYKSCMPM